MRKTVPFPRTHYKVGRSSAGLGIFATDTIKSGMYLEYVGDLISTDQANKKKGARYLFEINSTWTIDGSPRTNTARYFNHSCDPNCESTQKGTQVFIVATREIKKGEELTYDYGEEYVNELIKPHGCRCSTCVIKQKKKTS